MSEEATLPEIPKIHTESPPPEIQEALESAEKKIAEGEAQKDAAGPLKQRMPLFFCDSRFAVLRKTLLNEFQKKFIKLFKKVPKDQSYQANQEIAAWLASFVFENLRCTHNAWHTGERDVALFQHVLDTLVNASELKAAPPEAQDADVPPTSDPATGDVAQPLPAQGTVDSASPLGACTPSEPCCGAASKPIEPANVESVSVESVAPVPNPGL